MNEKEINTIAMNVILHAGNGSELVDQALDELSKFKFEEVDKLLKNANESIIKAHNAQTSVIQQQVAGENIEYSLLFVHAQDTLMTAKSKLEVAMKTKKIVVALWNEVRKND